MRKTDKAQLLEIMASSGYTKDHIAWFKKRYTANQLRTVISNDQTHDIITKLAKRSSCVM